MQLIGITMMRNEADIADLTIRHHLRIGCDRILAIDNGSSDKTPAILQRLARRDPRIRWTSEPGPYRQAEITTGLAREAFDLGADWIMPFDADEFWTGRPGLHIPNFLRDAEGTDGFLAPVVNFVQSRAHQRASRRSLLHMRMRAIPVPPAADAMTMVSSGAIGFVEIVYPRKAVFRARADVEIPTGNHSVENADGHVAETSDLTCLHAPLRSSRILEAQVEHGRRVSEVSDEPTTAWHARRWLQLYESGDFAGEWPANSYLDGALDVYGTRHRVEPDDRLRAAARKILWRHPFR